MKVCIAEKPSVAKEIAIVIGANSKKNGYYEGNGYQVTWTFGHFCTLKEPNDYDPNLKRWSLLSLPILPQKFGIKLIKNTGVSKQFKVIQGLVKRASEVINCGDAGQEGELIQRWVLAKAGHKGEMKRLWISSLTEEAIREGFKDLKNGKDYDSLYAAGKSRAVGDWLLGINATRCYTLKYGQNKQVLSIGRVQTPTLALIVDRTLEIERFKSEKYWELKTTYRDTLFTAKDGKYLDHTVASNVLDTIKGNPFTVVSFTKKEGKESCAKLYDLTSLQVDCNKRFGFSADETLKAIQNLYEKKLTTYPRVDTQYLSEDIHPKVAGILTKMGPYQLYIEPILAKGTIPKSKRIFDNKKVTDHHAIIPTGVNPKGIQGNEARVYDLVARRFIAVFYPDCIVSKTQVIGKVNEIEFRVNGKQILDLGWRVLYKGKEDNAKTEEDQLLPLFEDGETGPHIPELQEKDTSPPKHYTEATLLRAMETAGKNVDDDELREVMKENGIGRPSTRANIIETILRRKYIRKEKKNLVATLTGIKLIQTIQNELLKSAELTGLWEKKLRDIEHGKYDPTIFLDEMKEMVRTVINDVKQRQNVILIGGEIQKKTEKKNKKQKSSSKKLKAISCPLCKKGTLLEGKTAIGCSQWQQGCKFKIPYEMSNKKLTAKQLFQIVEKGESTPIKGIKINGEKKDIILYLDAQSKLQFKPFEKAKMLCPKCNGELITGKTAYGCSNWQQGCKFKIPFNVLSKKLTESQINQLLLKGKTNIIKGFVREDSGDKFNSKLALNSDYQLIFEN